jgi:flagellar biosynthetic protein FliR
MISGLIQDHAFGLLLILARAGTILVILPGLGESAIPAPIKAGMMLGLAIVILPSVRPMLPPRPDSDLLLAAMIAREIVNGLWFGWLARILAISLPIAGQFIAEVAGLSQILVVSADLGPQTAATSRMYELAVPVLILSTGLYQPILAAFVGFYRLVPPGTLAAPADGMREAIAALALTFELALRLTAPFILAGFAWNLGAGLMARMVPRLQIFFVMAPGQIGLGLILLAMLAHPLIAAWMEAMRTSVTTLPGGT